VVNNQNKLFWFYFGATCSNFQVQWLEHFPGEIYSRTSKISRIPLSNMCYLPLPLSRPTCIYTYVQISGIQQRWRGATSLKLWISFSPLSVSISLALTDSPLHKERPPSNTTKTTRERATHTWVNKSQP